MKKYKMFVSILITVLLILIVSVSSLSIGPGLSNASVDVKAESYLPEQDEMVKNTVVMYIGSPKAIVCGNRIQIDKQYPEVAPILHENDILIPIRIAAEGLGAKVEWHEETESITVIFDKKEIKLKLGSDIITANGVQTKMNTPVTEIKGRTLVPIAHFAEALGVSYDNIEGLIIFGRSEDVKQLTGQENRDFIQILIKQIGVLPVADALPVVGSYEKLIELLQLSADGNSAYLWEKTRGSAEIDANTASDRDEVMQENSTASAGVYGGVTEKTKTSDAGASTTKAPQAPQPLQDSPTMQKAQASESSPEHSTTNVQVEGVDEADIIKTDGRYIYQVNRQRVVIARAYPAEDMKVESIITFDAEDFNPLEMYLDNDKLIVIGSSYTKYESVRVFAFDIRNKANPTKIRNFEIQGNYVSSRKIGNYLYLIANKYVDYYRIMNDKSIKPTPFYKDSAIGKETIDIDLKHVHYFPGYIQPNYMIVVGINIVENDEKAQISTFLGSGQNIYASLKNLY
ncbi:MAG: hypothetical protein GYA02_08240, partial [Clostridiaceae bacterium]|nr:hypothetical protein [Clostridiaceae bacterium]